MSRPLYVWVEDGKLHRNPAFEDCNVDDAKVVNRYKDLRDVPKVALAKPCRKCAPLEPVRPKVPSKPSANETARAEL